MSKQTIYQELIKIREKLWEINDYLYENPEVGDQEFQAVDKLTALLREHHFHIENGVAGRATSFKAVCDSGKEGATVAFLCEYDALPEIGHGCGHNMIGTMGAGAGIALSKLLEETGGRVTVIGTSAEETNGAKVDMAEQGVFDDISVAMMVHPAPETSSSGSSLAMQALQFDFYGKASHAAAMPERGINALDAAILTFNGINAMRQHVTSDVRIHGIISEGGIAANIVPDKAQARFYVRARRKNNLLQVVEKVKNIALGAGLMTGAKVEISNYENSFDDMNTNRTLSDAFDRNLRMLGVNDIKEGETLSASMDMGNVSYAVPAIHPMIGIGNPNLASHTKELADHTITRQAHEVLVIGAAAMAYTGYDVLADPGLLASIREEFNK